MEWTGNRLLCSHHGGRVTGRGVRAKEYEEVWESIQCRAIVGRRTSVSAPVFRNGLAVPPNNIHVRNKFVGLETCSEDDHVSWNEAFVGLYPLFSYSFGLRVRQKDIVLV